MENTYPTCNPAQGLSELIDHKMRKLDTIDKVKYVGYYNQTCAELRELQYFYEGLSSLPDFDTLVEIQKAIDYHQTTGAELLNIRIPLIAQPKNSHAVLIDFTERRHHD